MRIIERKKITFASRLKELMKEHNMTQNQLAEKIRNPANDDNFLSSNSISNWMNGSSLRRYRKEILQQLADIFDVDPAYLECKQIERRNQGINLEKDINKIAEDLKRIECITAYLESIGIKIGYASKPKTEINEYLDSESGYIYTVEEVVYGEETSLTLTTDDKTATFTEDEFDKKAQEIEEYIKFYLFK